MDLELFDKLSKGRNGWFHPRMIHIRNSGIPGTRLINIEVWNSNQRSQPPVDLYLSRADALTLAEGILEQLELNI